MLAISLASAAPLVTIDGTPHISLIYNSVLELRFAHDFLPCHTSHNIMLNIRCVDDFCYTCHIGKGTSSNSQLFSRHSS